MLRRVDLKKQKMSLGCCQRLVGWRGDIHIESLQSLEILCKEPARVHSLGGDDSPPKFGGWIFKNHLFYSVFWGSLPKFGGWNLHPPNLGGYGFSGLVALERRLEVDLCLDSNLIQTCLVWASRKGRKQETHSSRVAVGKLREQSVSFYSSRFRWSKSVA